MSLVLDTNAVIHLVPQDEGREEESLGRRFLGGRSVGLEEFVGAPNGVTVRVTFDAESENPVEMQRQGWQAILKNFARHVEGRGAAGRFLCPSGAP